MERWEKIVADMAFPKRGQTVYIWGAGNTAVLNHQGFLRADLYRELNVTAFLDTKQAGAELFGLPIYDPGILNEQPSESVFVLICTTANRVYREIKAICDEKKIANCPLDGAVLKLRAPQYHAVAALLDDASRAVYYAVLANRARVGEDYDDLYAGESYFGIPAFCYSNHNDVVVDCGAYVGDSAERFIWRMDQFKKYIAIEPDLGNLRALEKRFARLREEWNLTGEKLKTLGGGVDQFSSNKTVETRVGGLGSVVREVSAPAGDTVPFWALDDLLPEGFTFLKADIESYEYRMLLGARMCIQKYHPRIAVCIYHNMIDMYSIPLLVHELEPTYRMAVRHHSYGYEETVLYAY